MPTTTTITTIPAGLTVTVDGAEIQQPHVYNWAQGSTHTVQVAATQGSVPRYSFVCWADGGDVSHTVTASSAVTVFCAEFQEWHQLSLDTDGTGSVNGTPSSNDGFYPLRLPVKVSASPSGGSNFVTWTSTNDLAANDESLSAPSAISEVLNPSTHFTATFTTGPITTIDSRPGVNTSVRVLKNGSAVGTVGVGVYATAPALASSDSSGMGQAAALNQDFSVNSAGNPAVHGSVMTLYATGSGQWNGSIPDGQVTGSTLTTPVAPVQVRIGKLPAKVLYAGTAPGLVQGVLQVNFQLPDELLGGSAVPVQLIVGDFASLPGMTVAVQ